MLSASNNLNRPIDLAIVAIASRVSRSYRNILCMRASEEIVCRRRGSNESIAPLLLLIDMV